MSFSEKKRIEKRKKEKKKQKKKKKKETTFSKSKVLMSHKSTRGSTAGGGVTLPTPLKIKKKKSVRKIK